MREGGQPPSSSHMNTEIFIKRSIEQHGLKYDYSKAGFVNRKQKVTIICKHHGAFDQLPYNHMSGSGCKTCGALTRQLKNTSKSEQQKQEIREKQKQTWLEKYGVEHPSHADAVVAKREQTNLEKYGNKHAIASDVVRSKTAATNIERYGVVNVFASEDVQNEIKQTNKQRYGTEYAVQSDVVREKVRATNNERYGCDLAIASETVRSKIQQTFDETFRGGNPLADPTVRTKAVNTMLDRYGVSHPMHNGSITDKQRVTLEKRYGVRNPSQSPELRQRAINTLRANHGVDYPMMSEEIRTKSRNSCVEKYGRDSHKQQHISEYSIEKLHDKQWLHTQYKTNMKTLREIAEHLSVDTSTVQNYFKAHDIPCDNHHTRSAGEREVCELLSQLGVEYHVSDRTIIAPRELDIVIPTHRIAIEYCGLYWHSDVYKSNTYHRDKFNKCHLQGYQLLTIFEDEWQDNKSAIVNKIKHLCKLNNNTTYARKCKVVKVNNHERKVFLDQNHIQRDGPGSITYGLEHNGELCAVMTFINDGEGLWNLSRYATSTTVVGGFTKLLEYFKRSHDWRTIKTFADLRWSTGDLYQSTGWNMVKRLPPDYYWCKRDNRFHKFAFRHSSLKNKLANYDPTLSEADNCRNNGYFKIYDCGKLHFSITRG